MKFPVPERVCGASWLKSRPEALCQLESGHLGEHQFRNALYYVIWVGDANLKSQEKIRLQDDPK